MEMHVKPAHAVRLHDWMEKEKVVSVQGTRDEYFATSSLFSASVQNLRGEPSASEGQVKPLSSLASRSKWLRSTYMYSQSG